MMLPYELQSLLQQASSIEIVTDNARRPNISASMLRMQHQQQQHEQQQDLYDHGTLPSLTLLDRKNVPISQRSPSTSWRRSRSLPSSSSSMMMSMPLPLPLPTSPTRPSSSSASSSFNRWDSIPHLKRTDQLHLHYEATGISLRDCAKMNLWKPIRRYDVQEDMILVGASSPPRKPIRQQQDVTTTTTTTTTVTDVTTATPPTIFVQDFDMYFDRSTTINKTSSAIEIVTGSVVAGSAAAAPSSSSSFSGTGGNKRAAAESSCRRTASILHQALSIGSLDSDDDDDDNEKNHEVDGELLSHNTV